MKIKQTLILMALVLFSLIAISAVSAADDVADDSIVAVASENEAVSVDIDDSEIISADNEDEVVSTDVVEKDEVLNEGSGSGRGTFGGNGTFNFGNMTFNINGTTFNIGDLTNGTFSLGNGTTFNISSLLNGTFSFGNGTSFNISSFLNGTNMTFDFSSFMDMFGASDKIEADDLTSVYTPTLTYKVSVKSGNKTVTQGNVVFTINNKEYVGHIGSDGVATVDIKGLQAGTYFIVAEYGQAMVKKTITIKKATPKLTAKNKAFKAKLKTKKYTVALKTNLGKALKKVKVTLKVKGKTYKATTNSKGKATFKITKLTKKGKHSATVKFAGNGCYKSVSKSVKITVK